MDIDPFPRAVRGHWGVENSCHWVLDLVLREDDDLSRIGHAAENLATLRRMTMNLLNREKSKKRGIKGKQLNASWNHAYLLRLLDFWMRRSRGAPVLTSGALLLVWCFRNPYTKWKKEG